MKLIDLTGQSFGRLTVDARAISRGDKARWQCRCICGGKTIAHASDLRGGHTRSCGCLSRETASAVHRRHGLSDTKSDYAWHGMMSRCYNKYDKSFANYGGRGITVCPEWHSKDRFFSDMGVPAPEATLERKNNNGPYAPWNCEWANRVIQGNNKRTNRRIQINGHTKTLAYWVRSVHGVGAKTKIYQRTWRRIVLDGWDPWKALTQ